MNEEGYSLSTFLPTLIILCVCVCLILAILVGQK